MMRDVTTKGYCLSIDAVGRSGSPVSFRHRNVECVQCNRDKAIYADEIRQFGGSVQAELLDGGAIG